MACQRSAETDVSARCTKARAKRRRTNRRKHVTAGTAGRKGPPHQASSPQPNSEKASSNPILAGPPLLPTLAAPSSLPSLRSGSIIACLREQGQSAGRSAGQGRAACSTVPEGRRRNWYAVRRACASPSPHAASNEPSGAWVVCDFTGRWSLQQVGRLGERRFSGH